MAQLIKLHDYISRYEWNVYRYPSQYIRLKKDYWKNIYRAWDEQTLNEYESQEKQSHHYDSKWDKLKKLLFMKARPTEETTNEEETNLSIQTEFELRQYFLDQLFPFQLKWATSTVADTSVLNQDYEQNSTLKYFLQRFPDIYLVMYYPMFSIKNAPVDGEIIMISPSEIEIITLMEYDHHVLIMAGDERIWAIEQESEIEQIMSPLIPLRRTEHMLRSILNSAQLEFPIRRTVLSRKNQIVYTTKPYNTNIIGQSQYNDWFENKRNVTAPLKNHQLKVAEVLLDYCISNSVKRPEWNVDDEPLFIGE